ncbi:MAG: hypothetical protein QOD72_100 [Acidimicrobiaceae bacterium]|nr:hypothetical protein [Acidimicrobiaceae bacterium]
MALSAERRAALFSTKLAALVRTVAGEGSFVPGVFGAGAAGTAGGAAWVLLDDQPAHGLGAALAWAGREGITAVNVLAESGSGVQARRATYFADAPTVWSVNGRDLIRASPTAFPPPIEPPPDLDSWRARIEAAGATSVLEHGVLTGEVLGLEVCRVTVDPDTGDRRLEVGVGAHDREAFLLIHGGNPPVDALADVVEKVDAVRRATEPPHALRRLAAERLLRHHVLDDPTIVGAVALEAAPPPVPRANVKDPTPCVASGIDRAGRPLVVVCSVGIDLEVVPFAADARAALGDESAGLTIVVPARDAHVVTRRLADRLLIRAEVVPLTP